MPERSLSKMNMLFVLGANIIEIPLTVLTETSIVLTGCSSLQELNYFWTVRSCDRTWVVNIFNKCAFIPLKSAASSALEVGS